MFVVNCIKIQPNLILILCEVVPSNVFDVTFFEVQGSPKNTKIYLKKSHNI